MISFRMRCLRDRKRASCLTSLDPALSETPFEHAVELEFSCSLVGQKSDKFADGALMQKEIAPQANGLQNLYSAVRSRPAPPTILQ
jgi:hypothetical protein